VGGSIKERLCHDQIKDERVLGGRGEKVAQRKRASLGLQGGIRKTSGTQSKNSTAENSTLGGKKGSKESGDRLQDTGIG